MAKIKKKRTQHDIIRELDALYDANPNPSLSSVLKNLRERTMKNSVLDKKTGLIHSKSGFHRAQKMFRDPNDKAGMMVNYVRMSDLLSAFREEKDKIIKNNLDCLTKLHRIIVKIRVEGKRNEKILDKKK